MLHSFNVYGHQEYEWISKIRLICYQEAGEIAIQTSQAK